MQKQKLELGIAGYSYADLYDPAKLRALFDNPGVNCREPRELGGDDCRRRTGTDDEYVHLVGKVFGPIDSVPGRWLDPWIVCLVTAKVDLHHKFLPARPIAKFGAEGLVSVPTFTM